MQGEDTASRPRVARTGFEPANRNPASPQFLIQSIYFRAWGDSILLPVPIRLTTARNRTETKPGLTFTSVPLPRPQVINNDGFQVITESQ